MRFPIDPPQAIGVVDNPYEIQSTTGIKGLRPLGPHPDPLLINRPRRDLLPPPQREPGTDTRKGEDRRQGGRRQYIQTVLVDTRLGRDRRRERRRPEDPPAPSIDETV